MSNSFPILFVGHGSPMNAIESSRFRDGWKEMGRRLGRPSLILAVSAHWSTHGQKVSAADPNQTIYDMYGFPQELYDIRYAPAGSPETARRIADSIRGVTIDQTRGIDHGVWSVLVNMYPEADIPVVMISTNADASCLEQYQFGQALAAFRQPGVLILASGNVVHNLRMVDWDSAGGADWAVSFDAFIKDAILHHVPMEAVQYRRNHEAADLAVPTREHYDPLLVALGAAGSAYGAECWNEGCELGSISMTSYLLNPAA